jgi:hypothetical protein
MDGMPSTPTVDMFDWNHSFLDRGRVELWSSEGPNQFSVQNRFQMGGNLILGKKDLTKNAQRHDSDAGNAEYSNYWRSGIDGRDT